MHACVFACLLIDTCTILHYYVCVHSLDPLLPSVKHVHENVFFTIYHIRRKNLAGLMDKFISVPFQKFHPTYVRGPVGIVACHQIFAHQNLLLLNA